jgi:hypothetical protein
MTPTVLVTCPQCKAQLKGPPEVEGKKVRCKNCGASFIAKGMVPAPKSMHGLANGKSGLFRKKQAVAAAAAAAAAAKTRPQAASEARVPSTQPKTHEPVKPSANVSIYGVVMDDRRVLDQIEEHRKKVEAEQEKSSFMPAKLDKGRKKSDPYGLTSISDAPRCAHCAAEMPSEKAIICINCGYNHQTRSHVATKRTYDITAGDVLSWRLPGIICALVALISVFWFLFLWMAMPNLAANSKDASWAFMGSLWFRMWGGVFTLFVAFYTARFAFHRLILDSRPPEIEKN